MNWIGFDYGKRYIGAAVGSEHTQIAQAATVISAFKGVPDWNAIDQLVQDWRPVGFIVGYPLNMDGSTQALSRHTQRFQHELIQRYQQPVWLVDERLSTHSARKKLGYSASKKQLDTTAATIILQQWFDDGMPKNEDWIAHLPE